ncbi:hypothetical protein HGI47_18325 [Novosphingobium sp. ERN07]|uniref:hypothetical protein n=1 Tax=Novosphingobium sp. ERN07 TaxID=2726187 RepID=UPI001793B3DD|nr:hypothetical protein [Novosphingobium sp. ERN07]NLR72835.1 hypothetical protein [Novosphingobium sp. ERN07]
MTQPIRYALLGKSGSGKSRAAEILSDLLHVPHIKTGAVCRQISHILFGNEDKRSTQRLDDALTPLDPCIFLRAALRSVGSDQGFVVDALRFCEDLAMAQNYGCLTIRISAPDDQRLRRLAERGQVFDPATDGLHRSETELDASAVDFEISNDCDLNHLRLSLARIVA